MNPLAWLDESISLRLMQTLLHFLWQGTAIAIVAFALEQLLRRSSAQARYLLNVIAMSAMAICLPVTFAIVDPPAPDAESLARSHHNVRLEQVPAGAEAVLTSGGRPETAEELGADRPTSENARWIHRGDAEGGLIFFWGFYGWRPGPRHR